MASSYNTRNIAQRFLGDRYARELTYIEDVCCTSNMTDKEIRESILVDLMNFHFWELEHQTKLHIDFGELTRHAKKAEYLRILEQLSHPDIASCFKQDKDTGAISIIPTRENLQWCMDYSGVWFEGYQMPDDVIRINTDVFDNKVREHGGVENLISAMAMELMSNSPYSGTVN